VTVPQGRLFDNLSQAAFSQSFIRECAIGLSLQHFRREEEEEKVCIFKASYAVQAGAISG
jgi:hypothetical protein